MVNIRTQIFHKKRGLETQKFEVPLRNTKAKVECVCFPIYITQITNLENKNNETWMAHPFFYTKWGLKPQIFEISLGTKMNV